MKMLWEQLLRVSVVRLPIPKASLKYSHWEDPKENSEAAKCRHIGMHTGNIHL